MKNNYFANLLNLRFCTFLISITTFGSTFAQMSATDQVIVSSTNGYTSNGRGFQFTPNVNLNVTELGKRIPNTAGNYTWTIWNNSTNSIVHQQASTSNTAAVYTYEPISAAVQLLQGVSYSLMMYCDGTSGAQYYYGSSSQVNSNLTYTTAVYCNSCTPNTNSTGVVAGFHYGTPDFHFTTCTPGTSLDTRTECSGYTWMDSVSYTSNNNTATHMLPNAAANGCDSIITLDLTIIPSPIGIETRTECNSYTWINGYNYTISTQVAQYTIPGGAANGCDSIAKLHLTIVNGTTGTDTRTECSGYTWIDGNTYTSDNDSATFSISGGAANGCDSVVTLNLTVYNVDVSVTIVDPTITANLIGASYQWLDCGNGNSEIIGATNQSFVPTTNGMFAAEITENGCVDTSNCATISSAGIENNSIFDGVSITPNPSTGLVNLQLGSLNNLDIKVFNTNGRLIYSKENINSATHQIHLKESPGIYFVKLLTKNQNQTFKLVIQ
jgi:hypothetical protein